MFVRGIWRSESDSGRVAFEEFERSSGGSFGSSFSELASALRLRSGQAFADMASQQVSRAMVDASFFASRVGDAGERLKQSHRFGVAF